MSTKDIKHPPPKGKLNNYWDPLYNPADEEPFPTFDWNFTHTTGIRHNTCDAGELKKLVNGSLRYPIKSISFNRCNFRGDFDFVQLAFSNCEFELCDFGYAKWENIKFSGCTFKMCSLTMLTFYKCQFIDCIWEENSMSGNETGISRSNITNPHQFIQSAYTCLDKDILKQHNTNPSYQKMRLELTKAKLARIVLSNLERNGDDKSYYEGIKTYLNQSIAARIWEAKHNCFSRKNRKWNALLIPVFHLESAILNVSGKINGWGYSIARPTLIGASLITFFGFLYYILGICNSFSGGIIAGFDVTMLFGYTKQVNNSMPWLTQALFGFNAFLGLWWYAVFVPTIINRISRVRG